MIPVKRNKHFCTFPMEKKTDKETWASRNRTKPAFEMWSDAQKKFVSCSRAFQLIWVMVKKKFRLRCTLVDSTDLSVQDDFQHSAHTSES